MESKEVSAADIKKVKKGLKRMKFPRQESWKYVSIHNHWRKPRGMDSKMRRSVKGWPGLVKVGYRTPKFCRYFHPSGFSEIIVYRPEDLDDVDPKKIVVRMARTVGVRKRDQIMDRAKSMGIRIINPCRVSGVEPEKSEKTSS
jgi:large subunit ribosomal protein L32e